MMSQEELLPWSEPDANFFADNLLGIEDWGDSITDIKLGGDDVLLANNDQDMEVNPDELNELLQNIGDDMWALSEDTVRELGAQIKQEPPSPSSSTSSLISLDSSLPSSPESQLLHGQSSPPYQPYTSIEPILIEVPPIKRETNLYRAPTCVRSDANLVLPFSPKNVSSVMKTEVAVTPSCLIKKEPITIQPCSLVKPLPNIPIGHVQKITLQNTQQPKLIQQGKGVVTSTTANITYIPVSGPIPTTAILVGNKAGLPIPKTITSVIGNGVPPVKTSHKPVINEKVMKRQQRMIKNRESACLSRKKKKEYLQSLEYKVKEVTYLNDKLNEENMKLKYRVTELEKENLLLKSSHSNWSSTAKKSTCVLAVVLLVALNIGPFSSLKDSWKFSSPDNLLSVYHGRALLQYQQDGKSTEQTKPLVYGPLRRQYTGSNGDTLNTKPKDTVTNMSTERKDLIVVKKKWDFLADMNRKKSILAKKARRLKNTMKRMTRQNTAKIIEAHVCSPSEVNTTESIRLNEALGDWIHKYQVEKLSRKKKQPLQRNKFKSAVKQLALRLTPNCTETEARKKIIKRHMFTRRHNTQSNTVSSKNAVQLFQGPDWLKVFSEAINRQDDTLYIVSFRQDHLIFPATKSNGTQRPKMSLMMMAPSNGTTVNVTKDQESVSMIQIDCQVMDTKHIKVKKSSLPMPFADSFYHYRAASKPPAERTPSIPTHSAK